MDLGIRSTFSQQVLDVDVNFRAVLDVLRLVRCRRCRSAPVRRVFSRKSRNRKKYRAVQR